MPRSKLLIATHNPGKVREYRALLGEVPFDLVSLSDAGIKEAVDETGTTFEDNARLKAQAYAAASGLTTLADDSGLEVDALGGQPGVRSARYGEDTVDRARSGKLSDQDRVALLIRNLDGVPWERRTARFRCVIAVACPPSANAPAEKPGFLEGAVEGVIQYDPMGDNGFGYDPVFYLPSYGLTMAQLPMEEKNRISHRAQAANKAVALLRLWRESHHEARWRPSGCQTTMTDTGKLHQ